MLNRVILITDGLANAGETNTDVIVTQAKGLYEHGISTTTIGVGNDFNEERAYSRKSMRYSSINAQRGKKVR